MDEEQRNQVKVSILAVLKYAAENGVTMPIDLGYFGNILKLVNPGFSHRNYGFEKMLPLLQQFSECIHLDKDDTVDPPRYYVYRENLAGDSETLPTELSAPNVACEILEHELKPKLREKLESFAIFGWKQLSILSGMALEENWGEADNYKPLRNYLNFTFVRLVYEEKVVFSPDNERATFNTGLADERFQPIYALLRRNALRDRPQKWYIDRFCVPGQNFDGKDLVQKFNPLPEAANYLKNPQDAIYNVDAGKPICDWEHIIEENCDRLPVELLKRIAPNFQARNRSEIARHEIDDYKDSFLEYIGEDEFTKNILISIFERSVDVAIKKVTWNYKSAVPLYWPEKNSISLALPLCLSSEKVDLALIVEKVSSGRYQGHTAYPLEWAYRNARLIARPDSAWLIEASLRNDKVFELSPEQQP